LESVKKLTNTETKRDVIKALYGKDALKNMDTFKDILRKAQTGEGTVPISLGKNKTVGPEDVVLAAYLGPLSRLGYVRRKFVGWGEDSAEEHVAKMLADPDLFRLSMEVHRDPTKKELVIKFMTDMGLMHLFDEEEEVKKSIKAEVKKRSEDKK